MTPAWMDINALCAHVANSHRTVDNWVQEGLLPPPKMRGHKRLWKTAEVDKYLEQGPEPGPELDELQRITEATRHVVEG